jgi:hypothetical protein
MTLKNLGPGQVTAVQLRRFVDIDADGTTGNIFLESAHSIAAVSFTGLGHGMVVGTLTPDISTQTFVTTFDQFDTEEFNDCFQSPPVGTPTADADHVAYIRFFLGALNQNQAKTVKIYYRKF